MTNEEKAQELARSYPMPPADITTSDAVAMIENAALQMAEWKEEQFIKFLDDRLGDEILVSTIEEFKKILE